MNRTSKLGVLAVLATFLLPPALRAEDNPLKSAKVGEWVETVSVSEMMGRKTESKMKQTVIAKDATSVTVRTVVSMMGKEMPPQDAKIMLDQPYKPYAQEGTDAKVTVLGEGDETITVGGKSYKCHWGKAKVVATTPMAMESTVKVWSSKDVPLYGMVKMESEATMKMDKQSMTTKTTMTLTGSGR